MNQYRGMTKDGKWVEGCWCKLITTPERHFINPKPYDCGFQGGEILKYEISGFIEVIPETVGQQTGLKDKNKKEIYGSIEIDGKLTKGGDIVRIDWQDKRYKVKFRVVVWDAAEARWDFDAGCTSEVHWSHEVIGNHTDNSELLE